MAAQETKIKITVCTKKHERSWRKNVIQAVINYSDQLQTYCFRGQRIVACGHILPGESSQQ